MSARQVDQTDLSAIEITRVRVTLDSDAGMVCSLLFQADQQVEESTPAGVRVAGEGDEGRAVRMAGNPAYRHLPVILSQAARR